VDCLGNVCWLKFCPFEAIVNRAIPTKQHHRVIVVNKIDLTSVALLLNIRPPSGQPHIV